VVTSRGKGTGRRKSANNKKELELTTTAKEKLIKGKDEGGIRAI